MGERERETERNTLKGGRTKKDGRRGRPYRMSGDGKIINLQGWWMRNGSADANISVLSGWVSAQNMGIFNYVCVAWNVNN